VRIADAARALGCSEHYVRQLLTKGRLAGVKEMLEGTNIAVWNISEDAVRAFLEAKEAKKQAPRQAGTARNPDDGPTYTTNPIERYYSAQELSTWLDLPKQRVIQLLLNDQLTMHRGGAYDIEFTEVKERGTPNKYARFWKVDAPEERINHDDDL
jgi:hypothetical protein